MLQFDLIKILNIIHRIVRVYRRENSTYEVHVFEVNLLENVEFHAKFPRLFLQQQINRICFFCFSSLIRSTFGIKMINRHDRILNLCYFTCIIRLK